MPAMTDPSIALQSFQTALRRREIQLLEGTLHPDLRVYADPLDRIVRITYALTEGDEVTAYVAFVAAEPVNGEPCFQVGYAVPEAHRGLGLAKQIVRAAIDEMQHGFARSKMPAFHIEAIVGADNAASRRVAESTLGEGRPGIDALSGLPAFYYERRIQLPGRP